MIDVRTFGDFSLTICGSRVERWRAGRARDLFQFLLLRPGAVVSKDTLCDSLWPETAGSANARTSLKVAVHTLRRILAEHLPDDADSDELPLSLTTCQEGYRLEVRSLRVDFQRFDELVDRGHRAEANGSAAEATTCYRAAVDLYQGEFLSGADAEWAQVHREWLRGRYLYALHRLSHAALAAGDHLSVMRWSRLMIDAEPFHEEAYRALIQVHAKLGQLGQVRRWYQVCSDRLHGELGISPGAETRRVYLMAARQAVESQQGHRVAT
jgi:DNA-binding SARP family transcriptional activator